MATNSGGYDNYDYYHHQQRRSSPMTAVAAAIAVSLAAVVLLAKLLRFWLRSLKEAQEADRRRVPPSSGGGQHAAAGPPPPAPAAVSVEMARSVGPLVCTYRRADGWQEAACAVCLAELADGEAARVLPECKHYFHAECVGEWLRAHDTCPLCRTPLDPTADV
ncbi:probable E3 ubiquitin-protein ligase ATL45 [Panicum virgatum]|uniref:RING-type domain-containing protein n=1 Tax=Panicum virgatum TaxID=38727 RepID=A0A8T0RKB6_PANVG|nr:probable E3 ubiquitin-protein ligase ATL45 [Panicum virgatum]KAG2586662.1 hypothetical protein PVAP13_5NG065100 [Panicum virgatum]